MEQAYKQLKYSYQLKFMIFGDRGVGKSSIFYHFIEDEFKTNLKPSKYIEYGAKILDVSGNQHIKLEIWNTNQDYMKTLNTQVMKLNAIAIIVVYDITKRQSFIKADTYMKTIDRFRNQDCRVRLVGNIFDIHNRNVSTDEGEKLAAKYNAKYLQISVSDKKEVEDIFLDLTEEIYEQISKGHEQNYNYKLCGIKMTSNQPNRFILSNKKLQRKANCC